MQRVAIILAAGVSKRMNTKMPKVLHEVCGRPMLFYVLDACRGVGVDKMHVVVGFNSERVKEQFNNAGDIIWVTQPEQKGTAHAVMCCREHLKDFAGQTLVLCGDGPLIRTETLKTVVAKHEAEHAAATLATAILEDPAGYGRIVRDAYGNIQGIIEDANCTPEQLKIQEVNPSYYLFDNKILFEYVEQVGPDKVKGEFYLTDALAMIIESGHKVVAVTAVRPEEAVSVNSREQLSDAGKIMQRRIQRRLMETGVTIVDPPNTWIDARAQIGQDTVIEPFCCIFGEVVIGKNCRIGPFAHLQNGVKIGDGIILEAGYSNVERRETNNGRRG
ncbi:MAG: sugar phosphate nucleotidyltransferase [Sedimentisphaerales bacterium]|jgi:bifunctional UDP-N-acetylglucosamine pyrophosphorylase/glucosamine-1-phosphate N-acetyltransferase